MISLLGFFLGLMAGFLYGWPWIFIMPLIGFILGFLVDRKYGKTRVSCCRF